MDQKTLVAGVISLTLSIILVGSILVPVVNNVQETAGAETTYENTNAYNYSFALTDSDVVFKMTVGTDNARTYTINGEEYTQETLSSMNAIVSDGIVVNIPKSSNTTTWGWTYYLPDGTETVVSTSSGDSGLKFSNGNVYLLDSSDAETQISTYTWVLYNDNADGDWVLFTQGNSATPFYVNSGADVICGGYYSSGSNDTFYTYKDGELTLYDTQYTGDVSVTSVLVDGTTDIYQWSGFSINVNGDTEENFVPYWFFVKGTITGHESSGAAYSLYGVIPVIVIIAIVMMAAGMIYSKRD